MINLIKKVKEKLCIARDHDGDYLLYYNDNFLVRGFNIGVLFEIIMTDVKEFTTVIMRKQVNKNKEVEYIFMLPNKTEYKIIAKTK